MKTINSKLEGQLTKICEAFAREYPNFRKFYIGGSEAYGYAMNEYDEKDLVSYFTIVPSAGGICWNFKKPGTGVVKFPFGLHEIEYIQIIHDAMKKTDEQMAKNVIIAQNRAIIKAARKL